MHSLSTNPRKQEQYKDNIVWVGGETPFFIIGIGETPDYAYPIIDETIPTVDIQHQAIVFVNESGYERVFDGFRTNWQENYISIRFKPGVSSDRQNTILKEIEQKSRDSNSGYPVSHYPLNVPIVTMANDQNDQSILVQERTIFIDTLSGTINSISYITTTLLIIFIISIVVMIFKVLVASSRKPLATMNALGHSKIRIALSNGLAALIIVAIPAVLSYIIGWMLQFVFIQIFDSQWTIPNSADSFSIWSLVSVVLFPTIGIFLLIVLITLWELRHPIPNMLNDSVEGKHSFSSKISQKMNVLSIKGKYAFALSMKNIGKLALLSIASLASLTAVMIGMGSMGKADKAYAQTLKINNYNFAIDLYTPTQEGGEYSSKNIYTDIPTTIGAESIPTFESSGDLNPNLNRNNINWHIPSFGDSLYGISSQALNHLDGASTYLHHKLQTKAFLNQEVGGVNPWDIAEVLMPENQKNIADKDFEITNDLRTSEGNDLLGNDGAGQAIYRRIRRGDIPYIISYGDVLVGSRDETYTYIDANLESGENFRIKGLRENTQMVDIDKYIHKVNEFQNTEFLPILVNKYIKESLKLDIGDTINININNHVKRNFHSFNNETIKAKIIDVVDGYNNSGIYTSQSMANKFFRNDLSKWF